MIYQTLLVYSTTDGHTKKICTHMQQSLQSEHHVVLCKALEDVSDDLIQSVDQIVVGASVRYGKFQANFYRFIEKYTSILETKDNGLFCVNLVARKSNKDSPVTNPYMNKLLSKIEWCPKNQAVFAGYLNYPAYGFLDKAMIRFIMWMTKGPTDTSRAYEFTSWEQVSSFSNQLKPQLSSFGLT